VYLGGANCLYSLGLRRNTVSTFKGFTRKFIGVYSFAVTLGKQKTEALSDKIFGLCKSERDREESALP
jgi:hypothetical protein